MSEPENKKQRKGLIQVMENHPKATFGVRLFSWFLFAAILPFLFLVWRFELFQPNSKVNFGGWGMIGVILIFIVLMVMVRYVRQVVSVKNVFAAQCLNGVCRVVLPLTAVLVTFWVIRNELDIFIQFLGCLIVCELIAIPLNPMPEWVAQHQSELKEEERKGTIDYFIDKFFERKKKGQK